MSNDIDNKINDMLKQLTAQQQELAEAETEAKKKWVTNCSFPTVYGATTAVINIQTQSEKSLVQLLADLLAYQSHATKAAELLGVDVVVANEWGGFPIDGWISDFRTRIAKVQLAQRKQELAQLETRLNAIVSPEQRRQMELELIMQQLSKDSK
jgi:hypothetical protein